MPWALIFQMIGYPTAIPHKTPEPMAVLADPISPHAVVKVRLGAERAGTAAVLGAGAGDRGRNEPRVG